MGEEDENEEREGRMKDGLRRTEENIGDALTALLASVSN